MILFKEEKEKQHQTETIQTDGDGGGARILNSDENASDNI